MSSGGGEGGGGGGGNSEVGLLRATTLPASSSSSLVVDSCLCSVCLEAYTEHGEHVPLQLPCGHTFCMSCLSSLLKNSNSSNKTCPSCRVVINGSVSSLPHNFALLEMMAALTLPPPPSVVDAHAAINDMSDEELEKVLEARKAKKAHKAKLLEQAALLEAQKGQLEQERLACKHEMVMLMAQIESTKSKYDELRKELAAKEADEQAVLRAQIDSQREFEKAVAAQVADLDAQIDILLDNKKKQNSSSVESLETPPALLAALVEASLPTSDMQSAVDIFARIASLCRGNKNMQSALGATASFIETLINLAIKHLSNEHVSAAACTAIRYLCKYGEVPGTTSVLNASKFGQSDASRYLVEVLRTHGANAQLVEDAFRSCRSLAYKNESNKIKLAQHGACQIVVEAMSNHALCAEVATFGCQCIGNLGQVDAINVELGEAGACSMVLRTLLTHGKNFDTQEAACMAVGQLACDASNRSALGRGGACEMLCNVLRMHPQRLSHICLLAIGNLAAQNSENKQLFHETGAVALITQYDVSSTGEESLRLARQALSNLKRH